MTKADPAGALPGVIFARGSIRPRSVRREEKLGSGRAAQVWLVCAETCDGQKLLCAEKVFRPGWLARAIYRASFQAPFPYAASQDAILATYYRRRVAAELTAAIVPNAAVARPLYVRWVEEEKTFALAAEYISGRGLAPQAADPYFMRRLAARRTSRGGFPPPPEPDETTEWLAVMKRLERLFRESGLVGCGWQVCPQAIVSTANLLRYGGRLVVVDLESGVPAALVPRYLASGWRLGTGLIFDDVDAPRLTRWLDQHRAQLTDHHGLEKYESLREDAARLIDHTQRWKSAEPALARHKHRVLHPLVRRRYRAACLARWVRHKLLDAAMLGRMREGSHAAFAALLVAGAVPGGAGRFLQRLYGDRSFRQTAARMLYDRQFRRLRLRRTMRVKLRKWHGEGRLGAAPVNRYPVLRFCAHGVLSRMLRPPMHRWLSDPVARRKSRARLCKFCLRSRFQHYCGRLAIRSAIDQWLKAKRLTPGEAALLLRQLSGDDVQEYVKAFALHLSLKLLSPAIMAMKVGGVSIFLVSASPLALLPWLIMPAGRTLITLVLMRRDRRSSRRYSEALLVGLLPSVGNFAYPIQMYSRHPQLATFLLRDGAARFGRWLPIYGGRNSLTEIWAIRSMNLVIEALDIVTLAMARMRLRRPLFRLLGAQGHRQSAAELSYQSGQLRSRTTHSGQPENEAVIPFPDTRQLSAASSHQIDDKPTQAASRRDAA